MIDPRLMPGLSSGHPRPIYRVEVDGVDITSQISGRVITLDLTDNRGFEADQVDLALDDTDGRLGLPARGATLRLAIGWADSGLIDKGEYTVDEVEHTGAPDVLTIRARSADLRAGISTQRERSWHDVTLDEIVRTVAEECGLDACIADPLSGQRIDHVDQTNETSANLLTRLAQQFDAIASVKNGRLVFMPMGGGRSASGKPLPGIVIRRESGDQHRFAIADRETYTGVKALYHDVDGAVKGEVIWGKTEDSAERKIPAAAPPPTPATGQYKDAGRTFKSREAAQRAARKQWQAMKKNKAQRAAWIGVKARYDDRNLGAAGEVTYGQADEDKARARAGRLAQKDAAKLSGAAPEVDPALTPSADNVKTLRHVYSSKANAQHAARAEWRRLQRGVATFSITLARGRAELFPELPAWVEGFKREIDNTDWILAKVRHSVSDGGFTTALDLEIRATEIPD